MGAVSHGPEIESLSARARRRESAPRRAVEMPFADVRGPVARGAQDRPQCRPVHRQPHVVHEHAGRQRILSGKKRRTPGRADRNVGDCQIEGDAFPGHAVHVRRPYLAAAAESGTAPAVLITKNEYDIG